MILNESSRDNLLRPIVQLYKEKTGNEVSVSAMKQYIFAKLVNEANIRNLSLDSNYYLAGAARYYVNGDLTINKNLNIFDDKQVDEFNVEICQRLNALILILRNSYIDSVGTKWEQPEDFGTLPLKSLLRKYGAAINKALGIEPVKKGQPQKPAMPTDFHIGTNGYTYVPIVSYEESNKYNRDTEPGAWCITYGQQHLLNYCRSGNGHFVFFLKDGYKDIPRKKEEDKWIGDKPQDTYGNSMIAFLQDNNSPGPANYRGAPLITSRWNHGANGIRCEADRAYTFAEFKQIVGITDEDLKRVYEVWLNKKSTIKPVENDNRRKLNAERLEALRVLKYAQIRANGGEKNPFENYIEVSAYNRSPISQLTKLNKFDAKVNDLLSKYRPIATEMNKNNAPVEEKLQLEKKFQIDKFKILFGNCVMAVRLKIGDITYAVLIDGNKILFETLTEIEDFEKLYKRFATSEDKESESYHNPAKFYNNIILCHVINGYMYYDFRAHNFIEIEGIKKFKYVPDIYNLDSHLDNIYFEVAMSATQSALIDIKTNKPLVLPNGHCWCEKIDDGGWRGMRIVEPCVHERASENALRLTYDGAAGTVFIYDVNNKKFIDPNEIFNPQDFTKPELSSFVNYDKLIVLKSFIRDNNGAIAQRYALIQGGKPVEISGNRYFNNIINLGFHDYFMKLPNDLFIWNAETGNIFRDFPEVPSDCFYEVPSNNSYSNNSVVLFGILDKNAWPARTSLYYIWSCIAKKFVKNPVTGEYGFITRYPAFLLNDKFELAFDDGSTVRCKFNDATGEIDIDNTEQDDNK